MSKKMLSIMDNAKAPREDMRYLTQPRGPATGWVFRMVTPPDLIGVPNPWDGRPFGKEIRRGLKTRHLPTARKNRDLLLGDIRRLESGKSGVEAFSIASAVEYREIIKEARAQAEDPSNVGEEFILTDRLERAEASGVPHSQLRQFSRIAFGEGYPIAIAKEEYIKARSPDNQFGYKPLKRTTVMGFETAIKHLESFLSDDIQTVCMEDITPNIARNFKDEYLTGIINPRSSEGLSSKTINKNITLLKPLWDWAKEAGKIDANMLNPWVFERGVPRSSNQKKTKRGIYRPEEFSKLLLATDRGGRDGDLLRLSIATGCRADEIAVLEIEDVEGGAKGFYLSDGKTSNAQRYVPVVGAARDVLKARVAAQSDSERVFPEWPIRPASGKAAAVSQWFTRFRRKVLGADTDKRLALHSTRHTWRTVARRAGVKEADINDLGGWSGLRTSNSVYDHGLLAEQLEEAQQLIWQELKCSGYLEGY